MSCLKRVVLAAPLALVWATAHAAPVPSFDLYCDENAKEPNALHVRWWDNRKTLAITAGPVDNPRDMVYDVEASDAKIRAISDVGEDRTYAFRTDMEEGEFFYYNINFSISKAGDVILARESYATIVDGQLLKSGSEQKTNCVIKRPEQ